MEVPLVSVVIVNFNGKEFLKECLNTIFENQYPNFEVIIVDNGSEDSSVKMIKEVFPGVMIVQNEKNFGPAYARNRGVALAKGEYIAFLDNDTRVDPFWLREAMQVLEADPRIGACQCKLIIDGTDNLIDCIGEYLGQNGFLVQAVIPGEEKDIGQYDGVTDIFAAKSAGMLVRKSIFDRIRGFDEDYFIYLEESDLCWRIWLQGYRVVLAPNSIVYHKFGTSSVILPGKANYLVKFHGSKNYISTLLKNLGFRNLIKIVPIHIGIWLGVASLFLLKGQFETVKWILKGIAWNFKNYKKLVKKRGFIQKERMIRDSEILPKIIRKRNFGYFINKLKRRKKVGQAVGWDKGV